MKFGSGYGVRILYVDKLRSNRWYRSCTQKEYSMQLAGSSIANSIVPAAVVKFFNNSYLLQSSMVQNRWSVLILVVKLRSSLVLCVSVVAERWQKLYVMFLRTGGTRRNAFLFSYSVVLLKAWKWQESRWWINNFFQYVCIKNDGFEMKRVWMVRILVCLCPQLTGPSVLSYSLNRESWWSCLMVGLNVFVSEKSWWEFNFVAQNECNVTESTFYP